MNSEVSQINLVKSGFGIGGASLADVELLAHLQERGCEASILTGYLHPGVEKEINAAHIPYFVDPRLDYERGETPATIRKAVLGGIAFEKGVIVFSQALSSKESDLGAAAIDIASDYPTIYRQHNLLAPNLEEHYSSAAGQLLLSLTVVNGRRFSDINPNVPTHILPPLINGDRFNYTPDRAEHIKRVIRQRHGLDSDSLLIFQPTRVSKEKGIEYTLDMAAALKKTMQKDVMVIIAGGKETVTGAVEYKQSIVDRARKLGLRQAEFLNGTHAYTDASRLADYMIASDIIACPSRHESFGLSAAEGALCKRPIFTKEYRDTLGDPIFEEVYGDFDVVKDPVELESPSESAIEHMVRVMHDPKLRKEMTEKNYILARQYTYDSDTYNEVIDLIP
jgi:glycosyltransferase involved in cell wall biosynthesis